MQAGGEADPNAPAAARAGAMASRQNTIFSLPLLVFMVGASHFYAISHFSFDPGGAKWFVYFIIGLVLLVVLELNALGKISGRGNTGLNVIYESHKNAMYTGFGLIVIFYILAEILLRALFLVGSCSAGPWVTLALGVAPPRGPRSPRRRGARRCGRGARCCCRRGLRRT